MLVTLFRISRNGTFVFLLLRELFGVELTKCRKMYGLPNLSKVHLIPLFYTKHMVHEPHPRYGIQRDLRGHIHLKMPCSDCQSLCGMVDSYSLLTIFQNGLNRVALDYLMQGICITCTSSCEKESMYPDAVEIVSIL